MSKTEAIELVKLYNDGERDLNLSEAIEIHLAICGEKPASSFNVTKIMLNCSAFLEM